MVLFNLWILVIFKKQTTGVFPSDSESWTMHNYNENR